MNLVITPVGPEQPEVVEIRCHRVTGEVREIAEFVRSRQGTVMARGDDGQAPVPIAEILYVESVDDRIFVYTVGAVFETGGRLYELEERLASRRFLRVSKSVLVNLTKITAIKPALNSRFYAVMCNGEQLVVSRKYAPELKRALAEGSL